MNNRISITLYDHSTNPVQGYDVSWETAVQRLAERLIAFDAGATYAEDAEAIEDATLFLKEVLAP